MFTHTYVYVDTYTYYPHDINRVAIKNENRQIGINMWAVSLYYITIQAK